jgi:hypothetical protein
MICDTAEIIYIDNYSKFVGIDDLERIKWIDCKDTVRTGNYNKAFFWMDAYIIKDYYFDDNKFIQKNKTPLPKGYVVWDYKLK